MTRHNIKSLWLERQDDKVVVGIEGVHEAYGHEEELDLNDVLKLRNILIVMEHSLEEKAKDDSTPYHTLWLEGFQVKERIFKAHYIGRFRGSTLYVAAQTAMDEKYWDLNALSQIGDNIYYWGRRLFDNETDAKRNFG